VPAVAVPFGPSVKIRADPIRAVAAGLVGVAVRIGNAREQSELHPREVLGEPLARKQEAIDP
jgi:hypothetical protein